jgi:hypothetical protein
VRSVRSVLLPFGSMFFAVPLVGFEASRLSICCIITVAVVPVVGARWSAWRPESRSEAPLGSRCALAIICDFGADRQPASANPVGPWGDDHVDTEPQGWERTLAGRRDKRLPQQLLAKGLGDGATNLIESIGGELAHGAFGQVNGH